MFYAEINMYLVKDRQHDTYYMLTQDRCPDSALILDRCCLIQQAFFTFENIMYRNLTNG